MGVGALGAWAELTASVGSLGGWSEPRVGSSLGTVVGLGTMGGLVMTGAAALLGTVVVVVSFVGSGLRYG